MTKPKILLPGQSIGILGAGQLGKMLAQSAQKMGYRVHMLDEKEACGFAVSHQSVISDFSNKEAVVEFGRQCDVLTYEFENIDGDILSELEQQINLPQGADFLLTTQHRQYEKDWLAQLEVPTVDYEVVRSVDTLAQALKVVQWQAVVKTVRFGYDGKGQVLIQSEADFHKQLDKLKSLLEQQPLIVEGFCEFAYEVSVIVARDQWGTIELFPPTINEHRQGILAASYTCDWSEQSEVFAQLRDYSNRIAGAAELVGVCGIEFFVLDSGDVLVNELAPRPHNTGHLTIESCNVSQFDQHILAITGRRLVPIHPLSSAVSVNILGQHIEQLPELIEQTPDALIHLYDKREAKTGRKMGHITQLCSSDEATKDCLNTSFMTRWLEAFE